MVLAKETCSPATTTTDFQLVIGTATSLEISPLMGEHSMGGEKNLRTSEAQDCLPWRKPMSLSKQHKEELGHGAHRAVNECIY